MSASVTYTFQDGTTYAIHQGKVIASSTDPDEVERQVKKAFGPELGPELGPGDEAGYFERDNQPPRSGPHGAIPCPHCGSQAVGPDGLCRDCGEYVHGHGQDMENPYPHNEPSPGFELGGEAGPYLASAVVTPNGLKGTVLGKVAGLWGDEVTVRLENGRIVKLPVGTELKTQKTASDDNPGPTPIAQLEQRLAATSDGTRESLVERSHELERIKKHASGLISEGVSYADSLKLDQLVITAEVEQRELADAVAHLDAAEPIAPPSFTMSAAHEAAGVSREDASWLDHTLDEMIKEAEATDFATLMDEGPEAFTAELPDVALADTGVTRQMASSFIAEKTAGISRDIADPYMDTFLARIEECRRAQLSTRKETTHKEAATQEDQFADLPDDALFL